MIEFTRIALNKLVETSTLILRSARRAALSTFRRCRRRRWRRFVRLARGAVQGLDPAVPFVLFGRGERHHVAFAHRLEEILRVVRHQT